MCSDESDGGSGAPGVAALTCGFAADWQNVSVATSCRGVASTTGPRSEDGLAVSFDLNQKSISFKSKLQDVIIIL